MDVRSTTLSTVSSLHMAPRGPSFSSQKGGGTTRRDLRMSFCPSANPAQKPRVAQGRAGLAKKTPRLLNSQLWIASTLDLPFFHRPCRQTWWKEFPGCMAIRSSGGSVSSSSTCYGLNHISQVIFLIIGTWNFQYCCTVNMKAAAACFQ